MQNRWLLWARVDFSLTSALTIEPCSPSSVHDWLLMPLPRSQLYWPMLAPACVLARSTPRHLPLLTFCNVSRSRTRHCWFGLPSHLNCLTSAPFSVLAWSTPMQRSDFVLRNVMICPTGGSGSAETAVPRARPAATPAPTTIRRFMTPSLKQPRLTSGSTDSRSGKARKSRTSNVHASADPPLRNMAGEACAQARSPEAQCAPGSRVRRAAARRAFLHLVSSLVGRCPHATSPRTSGTRDLEVRARRRPNGGSPRL